MSAHSWMPDGTDHAEEAARIVQIPAGDYGQIDTHAGDMSIAWMLESQTQAIVAQTHATLALAAQQKRVADWLDALPLANDGSPVVSPNPTY